MTKPESTGKGVTVYSRTGSELPLHLTEAQADALYERGLLYVEDMGLSPDCDELANKGYLVGVRYMWKLWPYARRLASGSIKLSFEKERLIVEPDGREWITNVPFKTRLRRKIAGWTLVKEELTYNNGYYAGWLRGKQEGWLRGIQAACKWGPDEQEPCPECGKLLKTLNGLQQHLRAKHLVQEWGPDEQEPCPECEELCPECGKQLKTLNGLQQHLKAKHSVQEPCPECGKQLKTLNGLQQHLRVKHSVHDPI